MQWNLRQHLEEAERQRRLAAGLPPANEPTIWHEPTSDLVEPAPERDPLADLLIDLRDPTSVLTYRPITAEPAPEPQPAVTLPRRAPAMALPVWQRSASGARSATAVATSTGTTLVRPDARATNQPDLAGQPRAESLPPTTGGPAVAPVESPATSGRRITEGSGAEGGATDGAAIENRVTEGGGSPRPSRAPVKDRCPHCGGSVRLDMFDLDNAVARMSCTDCGLAYAVKSPNL